jgi:cytochrome c
MIPFRLKKVASALFSGGLLTASLGVALTACTPPCRPYAPRVPLMQTNPCASKHPAVIKDPSGAKSPDTSEYPYEANPYAVKKVDPVTVTRPANYRPYRGNQADLLEYGEKLYRNTRLSPSGLSCRTCHQDYNLFELSFAQSYPHFVAMAKERAGLDQIHLDEMIQLCMVSSMAAEPLVWNSRALAALTTYTSKIQQDFKANPGAVKNPCAVQNPCAVKNPDEIH